MDAIHFHSTIHRKLGKLPVCCVSVWIFLGILAALLLGQYQTGVLHPAFLPFVLLLSAVVALVVVTLFVVVTRLVRGEKRRTTTLWFLLTVVPVVISAIPLVYAQQQWTKRMVPVGIQGKYAMMFGGSLMEAQAAWTYPKRLESKRLVMFYHKLNDEVSDIEAMDRHVMNMEQLLGSSLRSKIHWVRGSLVGQRKLSFLGLALGSTSSPARTVDKHELAHAVLTQFRISSAKPPMILHEGWAISQEGAESSILAATAIEARAETPDLRVVDLFNEENYRLDAGRAYDYGGAFVDFLLRKFTVRQFVELYNTWNAKTSHATFRRIYGVSISELESSFWTEAEAIAAMPL